MNAQPAILYVEDDPPSRKVMHMLLNMRMGLPNVTILENSRDFMTRVNALDPKPDVIFLDIHVDPYDGFEMLEMLREQDDFQDTPIVALTASVMNEEVHRLKTAGFHSCLAKPIDTDTFPDMLRQIMGGKSVWRIIG